MQNATNDAREENRLCCCICRGLGVCYLVCLASPVVLFAGVVGVAVVSLFA